MFSTPDCVRLRGGFNGRTIRHSGGIPRTQMHDLSPSIRQAFALGDEACFSSPTTDIEAVLQQW
jgi:hypothetical protein